MPDLIPANSPERPCWSVLSNLLGRREEPPADEKEARNRLRELLVEAFSRNPHAVVDITMGDSKTAIRKSFEAFAAFISAQNGVLPRGKNRPEFRTRAWHDARNMVASSLWVMGDGLAVKARDKKYQDLGVSTKQPIQSWLPERSGVIPYLRSRIQQVIFSLYEENSPSVGHLSIHRSRVVERVDEFHRSRDSFDITDDGSLVEPTSGAPYGGGLLEVEVQQFRSTGYDDDAFPDEILRTYLPGYNPSKSNSIEYVKASALALVDRLKKVDNEIKADAAALEAVITRWRGSPTLAIAFPELVSSCEKFGPLLLKDFEDRATAQFRQATQTILFTEEATPTLSQVLKMEGLDLPDISQLMTEAPAALNSTERPDYHFLSSCAGEVPRMDLPEQQLYAELRRLSILFSTRLSKAGRDGSMLSDLVIPPFWKPERESFTSRIVNGLDEVKIRKSPALAKKFREKTKKPAVPQVSNQIGFDFN